jgi:hypothetical protein
MNNYVNGSNALQEVAQFGALAELHRIIAHESASRRAFLQPGGRLTLIFILAALAAAPMILAWLVG